MPKPDEGDYNEILHRHGAEVFRRLPGFESCVWLRKVPPVSGGSRCMDFLLIDTASPRLAVVECGREPHRGFNHSREGDLRQAAGYLRAVRAADFEGIKASISNCTLLWGARRNRDRQDSNPWTTPRQWFKHQGLERHIEQDEFDRLLRAAAKCSKESSRAFVLVHWPPGAEDPGRRAFDRWACGREWWFTASQPQEAAVAKIEISAGLRIRAAILRWTAPPPSGRPSPVRPSRALFRP